MRDIFFENVMIHDVPDNVWASFIELEQNASKWMPGISSLRKTTDGPIQKGTEFTSYSRGKQQVTKVTDFQDHYRLTLTTIQGNFRADYTYTFKAENRATSVTLQATCSAKGVMKLLSPIIRYAIKKTDGRQLERFQDVFIKDR
ncbi:SRPBCC family protein [Bacillus spongiae]|uniref:SRPBCC family protein n=1 Tax=Bacillus spongiae TaxID=2683610 RepID=A0ABU8HBR4_9BACI